MSLGDKQVKSKKWWFFFPDEVYANDFTFESFVTEKEARAYVRGWLDVKRLPRYTQVWVG